MFHQMARSQSMKNKAIIFVKIGLLVMPIGLQVIDSLFDALYFVKLKTDWRMIHVPAWVHVAQAALLYTCKVFA